MMMISTTFLILSLTISVYSATVGNGQRCGKNFGDSTCTSGTCCSEWGFCGNTTWHCSPSLGCQNSCVTCNLPNLSKKTATTIPYGVEIEHCINTKSFAFTFDDGPGPLTGEVLKILADAKINATFFVLGRQIFSDPAFENYVKAAYGAGHQIALHSWDHFSFLQLTQEEKRAEIDLNICAVYNAIGKISTYFRAPYGETDRSTMDFFKSLSMKVIYWNNDPEDWLLWTDNKTSDDLYNKFVAQIDNQKQPVISLNHDVYDITVQALPRMIEYVKNKKMIFQSVAECLNDSNPYFN